MAAVCKALPHVAALMAVIVTQNNTRSQDYDKCVITKYYYYGECRVRWRRPMPLAAARHYAAEMVPRTHTCTHARTHARTMHARTHARSLARSHAPMLARALYLYTCMQVLVLGEMHAAGIIHRDLKPEVCGCVF